MSYTSLAHKPDAVTYTPARGRIYGSIAETIGATPLVRLDRLPKEQAEVIRLHTFASLRFTEIAQTLQLPASTVKSRFHYGIERLKKLM